jgi:acetyl esterase/lipase
MEKTVTVHFDVPYKKINGHDVCLDAVLVKAEKPTPMLVSIHGGGWKAGSKDGFSPLLSRLIAAGISWATIDYRLSEEATYPAQVEDCTYALQFIKSKAKEWNLDPDRFALEGHSAGGHLSLWVGLHPDQAEPASPDPVKGISTKVRAIVDRAGPADFSLLDTIRHEAHELVYLFLGHEYDNREKEGSPGGILTKEQVDAVSPLSYVSRGNPPVFIIHGTTDPTVPVQHSQVLEAALRKHGVECQSHYIEGGNHDTWYEGMDNDIFAFLKQHLA